MRRLTGLLAGILALSLVYGAAGAAAAKEKAKQGALPPGLQMKQARGEPLPPGWQKKLAIGDVLDEDIYARGELKAPLGEDGSITVVIEGTRLKLEAKTRTILGILD